MRIGRIRISFMFLIILFCTAAFVGCDQAESRNDRRERAITVEDNYGVEYQVITIEGCEFYQSSYESRAELTKIDCNCIPDTSNRITR